jgi:hypothetical protein
LLKLKIPTCSIADDRKQFSTVHAILFGPYLLAGMTDGDFEMRAVNTSSLSSWIAPVPASYSSDLFTFSQDWPAGSSANPSGAEVQGLSSPASVLSYGGTTATMKSLPQKGTNEAAQATFRINKFSVGTSGDSLVGKLVSFELHSHPGRVLSHTGENGSLIAVDEDSAKHSIENYLKPFNRGGPYIHRKVDPSGLNNERAHGEYKVFRVLPGLSGDNDTVSFEVATRSGCFIASYCDGLINVQCHSQPEGRDPEFQRRATFRSNKGLAKYHPMSFIAKGINRQYLLFPIQAYLDESYATYFNLTFA